MDRVKAGWSADWVDYEIVNKRVVTVIPGSFITPKVVKMTPFVILSESAHREETEDEQESYRKSAKRKSHATYKSGIPDPLFDFLAKDNNFQRSRIVDPVGLNSELYNSSITHVLWKDWNISSSQGIPDPWRNWAKIVSRAKSTSIPDEANTNNKKQFYIKNGFSQIYGRKFFNK